MERLIIKREEELDVFETTFENVESQMIEFKNKYPKALNGYKICDCSWWENIKINMICETYETDDEYNQRIDEKKLEL